MSKKLSEMSLKDRKAKEVIACNLLDAELAKGMADIEHGRVYSADEIEEEMHRLYGKRNIG